MLLQRREAKIRRKESSPKPGIELTTTSPTQSPLSQPGGAAVNERVRCLKIWLLRYLQRFTLYRYKLIIVKLNVGKTNVYDETLCDMTDLEYALQTYFEMKAGFDHL